MENSGKAATNKPTSTPMDEAAGAVSSEQAFPLEECGEIAATRLCMAFSDALKVASEQLFARGTGGTASQEQRVWLEAADFARNRRQDMVDRLRKHFEQRYSLSCRRKSALLTGHVLDFDVNRLRIVEHDVLENGLDSTEISEAIRNGSWVSLHELTKWFREALSDPEMNANDMPLGPRLIGGAVTEAVNDQFGGHAIKLRLLRTLCRTLPEPVDRLYRDLVGHLASATPASFDEHANQHVDTHLDVELDDQESVDAFLSAGRETPETQSDPLLSRVERDVGTDSASSADTAAADAVIDHCLASKRLPRFIAEFLGGPWRARLAGIHREHGPISPEWDSALRTMDDLIWSLRHKRQPEERARMMDMLPDLVKRLGHGLEALNEPIGSHHRFFVRLAECHIKILGASRPAAITPSPPTTPAPVEQAAPAHVPAESLLATLEPGIWLDILDPNFARQKLKLAWISPNRNLFLLTNHRGERALSLGAKDMAALLEEGGARMIPGPDATPASTASTPASQDKKTA